MGTGEVPETFPFGGVNGNAPTRPPMARAVEWTLTERLVQITADTVTLEGNLSLPEGASAVVLFAHGSGSGRHSPRNRHVARALNEAKLATRLIDLLTPEEE